MNINGGKHIAYKIQDLRKYETVAAYSLTYRIYFF